MRALVVQHTGTCPPARLGSWLESSGVALDLRRPDLGEALPQALEPYGALVVLGGEMNAYEDERFRWLPRTRALLAEAVDRELPTLAVCLGHQLLAVATGGEVSRSETGPHRGPQRVELTAAAASDPLLAGVGRDARAVHWNGDIVSRLPAGAVELARTAAGPQAYRIGPAAWGVQFHPEVDDAILRTWAGGDVAAGRLTEADSRVILDAARSVDADLVATWRPFTERFAALVTNRG